MRPLAIVDTRKVYDGVFDVYVPIMIGVIALFTVLIIGAVLVYRRNGKPSRRHENNPLEISYVVLLICVAAFLLYITYSGEHTDDRIANFGSGDREKAAYTIDVTGARWEWIFRYPGYNISHESGAVGDQPLVVPTNTPIRFNIRSDDVIHSLWIPQIAFKHDAIAGSVQSVTVDFDRAGRFAGSCSEYCGLLHSDMVFTVDAISPKRFGDWLHSGGRTRA